MVRKYSLKLHCTGVVFCTRSTGTQALAMEDMDNNVTANGKRQNEHDVTGAKVRGHLTAAAE